MERIRPKRSHWTLEVFDRAQELYNAQPTPTATQLAEQLSKEQDDLGATPSPSTIGDWIEKAWLTFDPEDAPWTLAKANGEDAALVLEVIRALIENSDQPGAWGKRPSRVVATWIVRIRRAYPPDDLEDPLLVYYLAAVARRGGEHLEKVETFLAFTPWRDDGDALARAIHGELVSFDVASTFGYGSQIANHLGRLIHERKEREDER